MVCPTSVLRQWQRELESKVSKSANMRVLVHHGVGRAKLAAELAAYDVVLTTFAVVGLEVASPPVAPAGAPRDGADASADGLAAPCDAAAPSGGAIGGVEWFRVVLDEAQSVKNARSQVAAAVSALQAVGDAPAGGSSTSRRSGPTRSTARRRRRTATTRPTSPAAARRSSTTSASLPPAGAALTSQSATMNTLRTPPGPR